MRHKHQLVVVAGALLAPAAWAQPFMMDWHTIDGGGGSLTGETFELGATIGQPEGAAPLRGGPFELTPGFWPGVNSAGCNRADLNGDYALNIDDVDAFVNAFLAGDLAVDMNGDTALNIDDIDVFVAAFLGGCP